jgi:outer membrane protein
MHKTKLIHLLILIALMLFIAVAFAKEPPVSSRFDLSGFEEQSPMSLDSCLNYAMQFNPGLLAARQDIAIANSGVQQAKSAQLPVISGDFNYQYYHELPIAVTSFGDFASGWKDTYDMQFSITQPIYTWGKITNSIQQAKYHLQIANESYRQQEQVLVYTVKQAFYQALLSQELVRVNQEAVAVAQAHLENAKLQFQQGTISNYEVLRSEVELANSKPDLINAQNSLKLAIANLASILGLQEAKSLEITGSLTASDTAINPVDRYPIRAADYDNATTLAFLNRPEWKIMRLNEKYQELAIPIAATGTKPTVAVTGIHDRKTNNLDADVGTWLHYSTAIVGVSWSLYDGWATKAKVAQARSNLAKTGFEKEQLALSIRLEVEQSILNLHSAEEIIVSQQKTIEQAKESLRLAESRYHNGVGTNLEVLDAKVALTRAETNFAQAEYNFLVARAQLEKVTGTARF